MRFLLVLVVFFISFSLQGQENKDESERMVTITTIDGTIISGKLVMDDGDTVTVETNFGKSIIERDNIKSLTYGEDNSVNAVGKDDSYSSSHYLLTQSGYGLKKDQSYYENIWVFWNSYTVGLSDNFSLSLGGEAVSLLVGEFPILFVTPKFSFPFNGGAFSVSTTLFTVPTNDFSTGGFLQGSLTLGNRRDNFTVGTGIGYGFSGGFNDGAVPVIVSGMKQVSEKISIVSENWFLTTFGDAFGIFSFGLRIHSQTKNNYLSVALLRTTFDQGDLIVWPFLSGVVVLK